MKKYLLAIVLLLGFVSVANSQVAVSQIFILNQFNSADTLKTIGGLNVGAYEDWYLEVHNISDSSRTFTLTAISNISPDTTINVNMVDLTAGTNLTTAVTGQQTLTTGTRKIYKIVGSTFRGFVLTGEGRASTRYKLFAGAYKKY